MSVSMQSPMQGESNYTNNGDIVMHSVKQVLSNRIVVSPCNKC